MKARFAVAAAAAIGVVTLPGALLPAAAATASPARSASLASPARSTSPTSTATRAARAESDRSPVTVAITGMTPKWAGPKSTITVSGTVTNVAKQSIIDLSVELDAGGSPFASATVLQEYLAHPYRLGGSPVAGQHAISSALKPGQSARWTIRFRAKAAGLTQFGVYPLTAAVNADVGTVGTPLGYAYTFLPYVPAKHGKYRKSIPAPKQVSWVWPMIDYPLLNLPGKRVCSGSQVDALHASLSPGGRLASLLTVGGQYTAQDQVTWAVDPALLEDVRLLSRCAHAPGIAKTAGTWLTSFRVHTKNQPMFVTPYADVELSLIKQYHSNDVRQAFSFGRPLAGQILGRNLAANVNPQITGAVWPPSGSADYSTVENLAAKDNVQTLLLSDSSVHAGPGNVFQAENGVSGTPTHVVLYSSALNSILGAATRAPGSGFGAAQEFLAETALLSQAGHPGSIVVAPPRRWDPPAGLAAAVLASTTKAPWLAPVPLASLERHATSKLTLPTNIPNPERFSRAVLRQFAAIDNQIRQISAIQISSAERFYLASTALESSAWHARSRRAQLAQIQPLSSYLVEQQHGISLEVTPRVILGGLKGTVPVIIDNRLDYPVRVRIHLEWKQPPGGGLKVTPPKGTIEVPANGREPVRIRVEAAQVGSTALKVWLLTPAGQRLLPDTVNAASVTVQATEFGNVAMIVLASLLGLFVIASAIRGARRRDLPPPGDSGGPAQPDPDAAHGSENQPETDTVVPERSEAGTAGTSGL